MFLIYENETFLDVNNEITFENTEVDIEKNDEIDDLNILLYHFCQFRGCILIIAKSFYKVLFQKIVGL